MTNHTTQHNPTRISQRKILALLERDRGRDEAQVYTLSHSLKNFVSVMVITLVGSLKRAICLALMTLNIQKFLSLLI